MVLVSYQCLNHLNITDVNLITYNFIPVSFISIENLSWFGIKYIRKYLWWVINIKEEAIEDEFYLIFINYYWFCKWFKNKRNHNKLNDMTIVW